MPEGVCEGVSMDFIIWLLLSKGFIAGLVVVDCFSIKFWKELFRLSGTQLNHSTSYHPQSDGQTEVVNRGLEQYLRAIFIKMSPNQALYGRLPLSLNPYPPGTCKVATVDELLRERNEATRQLKQNLAAAQMRMEEKENSKRRMLNLSKMVTELPDEFKKEQPMEQPVGEWLTDFQSAYPTCNLEDKVVSKDGGNVTPLVGRLDHGKWTKKAPKWQESFVMS
ncbi:ty3-gypsy retrotransposon protein [Tanacetum coccineum]